MSEKKKGLESIVPPLELCNRLFSFKDSALVWASDYTKPTPEWIVIPRRQLENMDYVEWRNAPTLAEILEALPTSISESKEKFYLYLLDTRNKPENDWQVGYAHEAFYGLYCSKKRKARDTNPATAALKLWLEVNGVASDKTPDVGHNGEEAEK